MIQSRFTEEIENQITEPWDELWQLCIHALLIGPGTWDVLLHAVNLFVMRPGGYEDVNSSLLELLGLRRRGMCA